MKKHGISYESPESENKLIFDQNYLYGVNDKEKRINYFEIYTILFKSSER